MAIDDHSRAGFVQMRDDERKGSAVAFLQAAVAHYAALGVTIKRLITDNGSAYRSQLCLMPKSWRTPSPDLPSTDQLSDSDLPA